MSNKTAYDTATFANDALTSLGSGLLSHYAQKAFSEHTAAGDELSRLRTKIDSRSLNPPYGGRIEPLLADIKYIQNPDVMRVNELSSELPSLERRALLRGLSPTALQAMTSFGPGRSAVAATLLGLLGRTAGRVLGSSVRSNPALGATLGEIAGTMAGRTAGRLAGDYLHNRRQRASKKDSEGAKEKTAYDASTFLRDLVPSALAGGGVAGREYLKAQPISEHFGPRIRSRQLLYQGPRQDFQRAIDQSDMGHHDAIDEAVRRGVFTPEQAAAFHADTFAAYDKDTRRAKLYQMTPYGAHAADLLGLAGTAVSDDHPILRTLAGYGGGAGLQALLNKYAPQHMGGAAAQGAAVALGQLLGRSASRGAEALMTKGAAYADILPSVLSGLGSGATKYLGAQEAEFKYGPDRQHSITTSLASTPKAYRNSVEALPNELANLVRAGKMTPQQAYDHVKEVESSASLDRSRADVQGMIPQVGNFAGGIGSLIADPSVKRTVAGALGGAAANYGARQLGHQASPLTHGGLTALGQFLGRSAARYI